MDLFRTTDDDFQDFLQTENFVKYYLNLFIYYLLFKFIYLINFILVNSDLDQSDRRYAPTIIVDSNIFVSLVRSYQFVYRRWLFIGDV